MKRGVWLVLVLLVLAVIASASGLILLMLLTGAPPSVPSNATLYLDLRAPYTEVEASDVFSQLVEQQPTLRETVHMIREARGDSRVAALVVTIQTPGSLWAQLQELRAALADFKAAGKPITAFLEFGGPGEYYVASVADRVVLMPGGQLDVAGLASYELFFRGLLDKLGIYPDLLQIGDYKTAANTFTERDMTPAHRQMSQSLTSDLFAEVVSAVAAGREMTQDAARAALTGGPYTPADALAAGLVDSLAYADQLDDEEPVKGTRRLTGETWRRVARDRGGAGSERVALIYAVGTIASGKGTSDMPGAEVIGSDTVAEWLRTVRVDPSVRAVVVRIDSPGGSAIASEVIWRELMLTREVKPLIVSMGDVAASGGYYIAAPAHAIVAQPGTLTGSIGIVTGKFVLDDALGKLGIDVAAVGEGPRAGIYSPFRPFTDTERALVQAQMRSVYDLFLTRVADGRGRTTAEIDAMGQGRVWTGRQALELGLVDELGGLDTALELARERAKLDPERDLNLVIYPKKRPFYEIVANPFGAAAELGAGRLFRRPDLRVMDAAASWLTLFRRGEPLALMPSVFLSGS